MKMLIAGDLAVLNEEYNSGSIDNNVRELFRSSDFNIVNLEAPVTDCDEKILKTGPHLKGSKQGTIDVLQALNVRLVTLANNHILDYGEKGLKDTLDFVKKHNIDRVGGGVNNEDASRIFYLETDEGRIAVINFAENEWASAGETSAGSNPMDLIENVNQIREAKKNADFVLVIIHGGHEYYNLPSPQIQKRYRFYADEGADIVISHHTHCVSGFEIHNGVPIYYSLGNFLFTKQSKKHDWYTGLIVEINIVEGKLEADYHIVEQEQNSFALSLVSGSSAEALNDRIYKYSQQILSRQSLGEAWENYKEESKTNTLRYWSPNIFIKNRYLRSFLYKIGMTWLNKDGVKVYLNMIRCESHLDLSREIFKDYVK